MIDVNSNIDLGQYKWQEFDEITPSGSHIHMAQTILACDREQGTLDFLTIWGKDGGTCPIHRHIARTSCIVLDGEQHFYDYDPDSKTWASEPRIRLAGQHGLSLGPDKMPHKEVGGPEGCVAFFSMKGDGPDSVMYEAFDDDMNLLIGVTIDMIIADFEANAK